MKDITLESLDFIVVGFYILTKTVLIYKLYKLVNTSYVEESIKSVVTCHIHVPMYLHEVWTLTFLALPQNARTAVYIGLNKNI